VSADIQTLTAAVEKLAKLELLAKQLPDQLQQARDAVQDAYQQLGITPPGVNGGGGKRRPPGETTAAILDALPATAAELRVRLPHIPASSIHTTLNNLVKRGEVVRSGEIGSRRYEQAGES
jgi:hypothetical protein